MKNSYVNENKQEDEKYFKKFIFRVLIAAIIGGIIGGIYNAYTIDYKLSNILIDFLKAITPFSNLIIFILVFIMGNLIYTDCLKKYKLCETLSEEDEFLDKVERNLSYLDLFLAIACIMSMFFIGIGLTLKPFHNENMGINFINLACFLLGSIFCIGVIINLQNKIVNLKKEINPLLKGNIYDVNFAKKWVESCDESLKLKIFKSSYKSFISVNFTCKILWIFCILGYSLFGFGITPLLIVTIIWLVQMISYYIEDIK